MHSMHAQTLTGEVITDALVAISALSDRTQAESQKPLTCLINVLAERRSPGLREKSPALIAQWTAAPFFDTGLTVLQKPSRTRVSIVMELFVGSRCIIFSTYFAIMSTSRFTRSPGLRDFRLVISV